MTHFVDGETFWKTNYLHKIYSIAANLEESSHMVSQKVYQ